MEEALASGDTLPEAVTVTELVAVLENEDVVVAVIVIVTELSPVADDEAEVEYDSEPELDADTVGVWVVEVVVDVVIVEDGETVIVTVELRVAVLV